MKKTVKIYRAANGSIPFEEWIENLKDVTGRARIKVRIDRVIQGNYGDYGSLGAGIIELRVHHGPGYRVYAGLIDLNTVVLLCGGDKSSQEKDIARAYEYWNDFRGRP